MASSGRRPRHEGAGADRNKPDPDQQRREEILFTFFRTLHAWAGVVLALLLILSGLTGSLLVWKPDYLRLADAPAAPDFRPTAETLAPLAQAVEARYDSNEVLQILFPTRQLPLARVTLAGGRYAYFDVDGNVVDEWTGNGRWEEWLYDLHHRLLLDNLGLTIAGLGALALIILVLFGLVAFWPLRHGFRRGFWPGGLARPRLLVSHRNLGVVLALPLLLSLGTGVLLAFPEEAEELLLEEVRNSEAYNQLYVANLDDISGGDSGDWLPAMRRAQVLYPDAVIRSAQVPNAFSYYRILGLQQAEAWNDTGLSKVYIEAESGHMDVSVDATELPLVERAYNAAHPLHTGRIGSLPYKILLSLAGLLAAALSFMGLVSFLKDKAARARAWRGRRRPD